MGETALAIDFGTSNTAAAFRDAAGRSSKIQLSPDGFLMPSAVFVDGDTVLVGRTAMRLATSNPEAFEPMPKRRLREPDFRLGSGSLPAARLVSAVLSEVLAKARAVMGAPPDHVILTHPDTWTHTQSDLFVSAGVAAGVDRGRIRLVSEATSAGWYYTVAATDLPVGARLAVVDFGADSCDVAVLDKRSDGTFVVGGADGLTDLGGRVLDERIRGWVLEQLDPALAEAMDTPSAHLTLSNQIREAKEALSEAVSAPIVVTGAGNTMLELTRAEFERLIASDIERAVTMLGEVLAAAEQHGAAQAPVTIYLTGGSSAVPLLRSRLSSLGPVNLLGDPKTVVAQGALLVPAEGGAAGGVDDDTVVNNAREKAAIAAARNRAAIPAVHLPAAGWYPDPRNPRADRYWTGSEWGPQPMAHSRARPTTQVPRPNTQVPQSNPHTPRPAPPRQPERAPQPRYPAPTGYVGPESPTKPVEPPDARTQTGIPLKFAAGDQQPPPFAETQVAPLPIFPRSVPALSSPGVAARPSSANQPAPPALPAPPAGRPGLTDRWSPLIAAIVSALLLLPTAGLLFAFQKAGTGSDFVVLWQWQPPSTAWFVAPYLYLVGVILLLGRTPRLRLIAALVALGALAFHMAASAALASVADSTMYLRLVYGVAGVIAICAWAIARRTHRSWLIGLVLAAPAVVAIRYLDQMVTINNIAWIAVWIQYFGSFAVGSVILWAAAALGAPQTGKAKKR